MSGGSDPGQWMTKEQEEIKDLKDSNRVLLKYNQELQKENKELKNKLEELKLKAAKT